MNLLAQLCRIYPGYTLEGLRDLTVGEFNALVEATKDGDD